MNLESFIKKSIEILSIDRVIFDKKEIEKYLQNVCGADRKVLSIVFPDSEEKISEIISLSRKNNIPLYPISKGCNFGLGSRLPVEDDHIIVDLSKMNRILYFDNDLGVIHIEPGVSQEDVANYLKNREADFVLNVTGSSSKSSLIGNAIERGVGHYGSRVSEVINFDMILGNGEKISTGLAQPKNNFSFYSYPHGLGSDLKGLFFQSNFGIVTGMTIRLLPKTHCVAIVTLEKIVSTPIEMFIDQLRIAKQRNLLPENIHISNKNRRLSIVTPLIAKELKLSIPQAKKIAHEYIQSDWAATVSLRGEREVLEAQIKSLREFIKNSAKISILFASSLDKSTDSFLSAVKGIVGHSLGIPCDDAILSLGYELNTVLNCPLEQSDIGTLFMIPVLPFRGSDFLKVVDHVTNIFNQYQFKPYMTFNLVEHINMEGVINLVFPKADEYSTTRAYACISELTTSLECLGYPPMRLSIFQKSKFLSEENNQKKIRKQLKLIFDPDNIIARGRYE